MEKNYCPGCGHKLEQNSKFCSKCGYQIAEKITCPECGKKLHPDTELCPACNTEIIQDSIEIEPEPIEKQKTLIQNIDEKQDNESLKSNNHIESQDTEEYGQPIQQNNNNKKLIKNHKLTKHTGRIEVARFTMLLMGIIILVQNVLLIGMLTDSNKYSGKADISYKNKASQRASERQYRGFGEKNYNGPESEKRYDDDMHNKKNKPGINSKLYKILVLVIIIGFIQGIGFILLSKYVNKNAFIAILVAFIFELTYGLLKIVSFFYRAIYGVNLNFAQFNKILSQSQISILLFLQAFMLTAVTVILLIFLGRGLKSAIELRKMEKK